MTMKLVAHCLFLAGALLMITSTMNAQSGILNESAGRRTELESLDRGFDIEGITVRNAPPGFWETPAGKARYEQIQMENFEQDVEALSELGEEDWVDRYDDSVSDRRARGEFEDRVEDLEDITNDLIDFFEWRFDAEPIEVDDPSEESVRNGVVQISPLVDQILDAISTLQSGGIQVEAFVEMWENLAWIHALSRVIRD